MSDRLDDISERNPNVSVEQVREVERLLDALKQRGIRKRDYDIRSPYDRGLVQGDNYDDDTVANYG